MRPPLHSQHIEHIEEEAPLYFSLPNGLASAASPYPAFPTSVQHVDPTIEHDSPDAGHGHNEEHHAAHHAHSLMDSHSPPLDPDLSPETASIGHQHLPQSPPLVQHDGSAHQLHGLTCHVPPNAAPQGHFDMLPPPASIHSSWQALHDSAQLHASAHGYALSINTTAKNRSRIKLACVCYGLPKNTHKLTPETRVRKNRVSYKTGCKMWVEGKKQEDGSWVLRVGEASHNHPGRSIEGWAVQRKRTWGLQGGRIGVGGVTAKEEKERLSIVDDGTSVNDGDMQNVGSPPMHSLESGGLVWRIVEQEMLHKGGPGQGRDRGVGRTVKVLEERLPGIHIFKRDVYNIRAQIKRARKAANQQIGEGLDDSEDEDETDDDMQRANGRPRQPDMEQNGRGFSEIDPTLVAQCSDALKNVTRHESEVDGLKAEVAELRKALARQEKELEEKNAEVEGLRAQVGLRY